MRGGLVFSRMLEGRLLNCWLTFRYRNTFDYGVLRGSGVLLCLVCGRKSTKSADAGLPEEILLQHVSQFSNFSVHAFSCCIGGLVDRSILNRRKLPS